MTTLTQLDRVCEINPRLATKPNPSDPVSFLGMADVSEDGTTGAGHERLYEDVQKGFTNFLNGDLLVAKITPCFQNGKIAEAGIEQEQGFGSTEFHVIRPNVGEIDRRYLLHFLRLPNLRVEGERRMTGSGGQRRVPTDFLRELKVPLPPLPEQRRIAAILDHADALRTNRRESLTHLDELAQSFFIDMFGDPVTNPLRVPKRRLGDLGGIVTGNTPPRSDASSYGNAIEWIKSDNIAGASRYLTQASEGLSESGKRRGRVAPADSLLITCIAGSPNSIGNVAIADREVAFNQQINAFLPKVGPIEFWYVQFKLAKRLIQSASTGGMKGLVSKSSLADVELLTPSIDNQLSFSEMDSTIRRASGELNLSMTRFDHLFASLQSRAFRGEL